MKYLTLNDLSIAIRKNIWKIPRDFDLVVGVARSGMIPATMIAEHLNLRLTDIDGFIGNTVGEGGFRMKRFEKRDIRKVLVVDDTVYSGTSISLVKKRLHEMENYGDFEFTYLVSFLEGSGESSIDIWLEDVRMYTENFTIPVYYEWNIFNHNVSETMHFVFDMDGVICVNPPDERDEKKYLEYIANAIPLMVPSVPIGAICTYRLFKNLDITKKWLSDHGVHYEKICMVNSDYEGRSSLFSPQKYKSDFYSSSDEYRLFIESDPVQAKDIAMFSKKPVLCYETNELITIQ